MVGMVIDLLNKANPMNLIPFRSVSTALYAVYVKTLGVPDSFVFLVLE